MMRKNIYRDIVDRIIPVVGFFIFLLNLVYHITKCGFETDLHEKDVLPVTVFYYLDTAGIILFAYMIFNPLKYELYGIFGFLYMLILLTGRKACDCALLIFVLILSCLYARGFFMRNRKIKLVVCSISFVIPFCTRIRYGRIFFYDSLFSMLRIFLVTAVIFLILFRTLYPYIAAGKKDALNLDEFSMLEMRDKEWICGLLMYKKYDILAAESFVTVACVKKRMKEIYAVLGVPDQIGFYARYSNRPVINNGKLVITGNSNQL
ncbi:MAG: hypothetical protein M0P01_14980 [Treponema sp.]|nr:hypothetical protein [Treponema sp.]